MNTLPLVRLLRLVSMGLASLFMCHALQAAALLNGGFDNGKTNWTGSDFKAGNEGGDGWNASYYGGTFPTNNTFASAIESTVRQNLSGPANTFVEGTTYTVSMSIFGSINWQIASPILWSLGFTADGTLLATDHWFSEEFSESSVGAGNGGTIPDDHIVTVNASSTGLRTVTFSYTATAADTGKVIGVQMGGRTQSKYTLAPGAPTPNPRYGMMDDITFSSDSASILAFASDIEVIDGAGFYLSWTIDQPELIDTLTLDSGSGPANVKDETDLETGEGFIFVEPTSATTYTLLLNGNQQNQITVHAGKVLNLTRGSNVRLARAPSYEITLEWSVFPTDASVSLSDGVSSIDVTADTDPETGFGSKVVTVPSSSTIFTLSANGSPLVATTRVLRESSNTAAFSINSTSLENGQQITVTWTGAAGAATDWVGIYRIGETPGGPNEYSANWNYLSGTRTPTAGFTDGSMSFTMPVGNYYAVLLLDDGYVMAEGPLVFSVVEPPSEEDTIKVTSITREANGVTLVWESKAGVAYSIYGSGDLQGDPLADWDQVSIALPSDGDNTTDFTEPFESGTPDRRFYRIYEVPAAP